MSFRETMTTNASVPRLTTVLQVAMDPAMPTKVTVVFLPLPPQRHRPCHRPCPHPRHRPWHRPCHRPWPHPRPRQWRHPPLLLRPQQPRLPALAQPRTLPLSTRTWNRQIGFKMSMPHALETTVPRTLWTLMLTRTGSATKRLLRLPSEPAHCTLIRASSISNLLPR